MKVSELVERTGVSLATVKFYIRAGVLAQGLVTSRTQAEYDESHVERLALIKVLRDTVGLSMSRTRIVLEQIDRPDADPMVAFGAALAALPPYVRNHGEHPEVDRLVRSLGWRSATGHPLMDQLEEALAACRAAGLALTDERIIEYAYAMLEVARIDILLLPEERGEAIRAAVVGTAVGDVLLVALRRLAQLQVFADTT